MVRRWYPIVALVALAFLLLSGFGALTGLGVPAWFVSAPSEGESLDAAAPGEPGATSNAGGPRLEGQPLMTPGGAGGTGAASVTGPRITGRCVDATGKGIAGARVISIPDTNAKVFALEELGREGCPGFTATTDAEGRFAVRVSKEAPYHIVLADAPGFGFTGRGHLAIGADVTLRLANARTLSGRVLNTKGEPVAGARVRALLLTDTLRHTLEAVSAADGTYRLEGWPATEKPKAGDWIGYMQGGWIEVTAAGYAPLTVSMERYGAAWKDVQDWTLARGVTLVGKVQDAETGRPIAAAEVVVHSIEGMQGYSRGAGTFSYSNPYAPRVLVRSVAGADGGFTIEHLPCAGPHGSASNNALASGKRALGGVSSWAPGYAASAQDLELAADGDTLEVTLALWPARALTGRVVEEGGGAVEGVTVSVSVEGRARAGYIPPIVGDAPMSWAKSDAQGRFSILGAPGSQKGEVELKLAAHELVVRGGARQPRTAERKVRVGAEPSTDVGDIVLPALPPRGPVARVRVLTPDGRPYYGATVGQGGWSGRGARTDAEGLVEVTWPAPRDGEGLRPMHQIAQAPGYAPTPFTLQPPSEVGGAETTVRLLPGHRLEGRVVQPDGTPAAGATVLIADGTVPADRAIPSRDQAFQRVGQVPAEGGRASMYAVAYTEPDGTFVAKDLPAGPYHVRSFGTRRVAPPPGTPPLEVTLSDVASGTLDLVVRLPADDSPVTGALLVRVLDGATREPVLDATLWARLDGRVVGTAGSRGVPGGPPPPPPAPGPAGVEPSGPGKEPGTYRLSNLPVGRVTLEIQSAGRRLERLADVEVVAERTTPTPDVYLVRGVCVSGRVDVPKGERAVERQVLFLLEGAAHDAPQIHAPLAADGTFSICGFAPGRYAVRCLSQGFSPQPLVLIPAAGPDVVVPEGSEEVRVEGPWVVAGTLSLRPDDARLPPAPWNSERSTPERDRFGAGTRVTVSDGAGRTVLSVQPVRRHWLGASGALYLLPGRYVARIQFPDGEAREEAVDLAAGAQADVTFRKQPSPAPGR